MSTPVPISPGFKWRTVGFWWLVQTLLILFLNPAYLAVSSTVDGPAGRLFGRLEIEKYLDALVERELLVITMITSSVIGLLQLLILLPMRKPQPRLKGGWPLWLAITAACACGALMAGAIFLAVMTIPQLIGKSTVDERLMGRWFLGVMLISWLVATPLIMAFVRKRLDEGQTYDLVMRRLSALLFKGTVVEVMLIIPLDVMVRRKTDCYCGTGTFLALTLCIGVGIITLGPIVLLPVFARRNKPWFKNHCDACGYDLSGLPAPNGESASTTPRCPECGAGWRA